MAVVERAPVIDLVELEIIFAADLLDWVLPPSPIEFVLLISFNVVSVIR